MKKFTKIMVAVLLVATIIGATFAFVACNEDNAEYKAVDAIDLLQEDFGIAITKGNTALKSAVDAVINEWLENGKMNQYMDYYTALAEVENGGDVPTAPAGLTVDFDFGTATEIITVYTESGFAPYEFIYENDVVGLDMAIMSQAAINLGKKLDIQDVAFDTIPTLVQTATGDAVGAAGMTINAERLEQVDFSAVYSSSTLVVVSKDGAINSVKDLAGKKVGVQQGTSGDLIISAAITAAGYTYETEDEEGNPIDVTVKAEGATVSQYQQYALAFADLKNGKIDAILMDKIPALLMLG